MQLSDVNCWLYKLLACLLVFISNNADAVMKDFYLPRGQSEPIQMEFYDADGTGCSMESIQAQNDVIKPRLRLSANGFTVTLHEEDNEAYGEKYCDIYIRFYIPSGTQMSMAKLLTGGEVDIEGDGLARLTVSHYFMQEHWNNKASQYWTESEHFSFESFARGSKWSPCYESTETLRLKVEISAKKNDADTYSEIRVGFMDSGMKLDFHTRDC